jgi:4-hydroxybenzoate polyprenyltransferase
MFGGGYDATWLFSVRSLAALLCVAFAVKMMDDFMDLRHDVELGVPSIAARLGEATLPYAMLLLALAALFDGMASLPLFAASYAVGMAFDLSRPLPSGLYGWQEAALALVAGAILAGPLEQLWALCVVAFVQCMDDVADREHDWLAGTNNLVRRFGLGEVSMAALALFAVAAWLRPFLTAGVVVAVACAEGILWRLTTGRPKTGVRPAQRGWAP